MIGAACCRVLEKEMRAVLQQAGVEHRVHVLDWGLHIHSERLREEVEASIRTLQEEVSSIVLFWASSQRRLFLRLENESKRRTLMQPRMRSKLSEGGSGRLFFISVSIQSGHFVDPL